MRKFKFFIEFVPKIILRIIDNKFTISLKITNNLISHPILGVIR